MKLPEQKSWTALEIKKAERTLERTEHSALFFSKIVFWSALLVIVFANLIVTLILIPFLVVLNKAVLYALVILLAGMIGFLYTFLITDIGYLEKRHHRLASVLVPLLAFANALTMVFVANRFIADLQGPYTPHNPLLISLVFGGAFILPYVADQLRLAFRKKEAASQ